MTKAYELEVGTEISFQNPAERTGRLVKVLRATEHGGDQVRIRVQRGNLRYNVEVHRDVEFAV